MGDETRKAIGLFWDIENCRVPRFVSALSVVQRLRERFFDKLREAEFMCVCDINKEHKNIIEELNSGQVGIIFNCFAFVFCSVCVAGSMYYY